MPDLTDRGSYGVNTSNTFAALDEEEESGKEEQPKQEEPVPRKKVDKKDKEKHGKQTKTASVETRPKKNEGFDRRSGPGPQRKPDKKPGGKGEGDHQRILDDEQYVDQEEQEDVADDVPAQDARAPDTAKDAAQDSKDTKDSKDAKDSKDSKDEKDGKKT